MQMRTEVRMRIVRPSLGTRSLSTVEPFPGARRDKKSYRYGRPRESTSHLPMQLKRHFGFVKLFSSFSVLSSTQQPFSATINLPSRWQKSTSITHALNILMSDFTLSVGSSKTVNTDLFTALPRNG